LIRKTTFSASAEYHGPSSVSAFVSIKENDTVENLAQLFAAAKAGNYSVFISPHFLYPHDQRWQFGGVVEK
jgi:hypothetical protein